MRTCESGAAATSRASARLGRDRGVVGKLVLVRVVRVHVLGTFHRAPAGNGLALGSRAAGSNRVLVALDQIRVDVVLAHVRFSCYRSEKRSRVISTSTSLSDGTAFVVPTLPTIGAGRVAQLAILAHMRVLTIQTRTRRIGQTNANRRRLDVGEILDALPCVSRLVLLLCHDGVVRCTGRAGLPIRFAKPLPEGCLITFGFAHAQESILMESRVHPTSLRRTGYRESYLYPRTYTHKESVGFPFCLLVGSDPKVVYASSRRKSYSEIDPVSAL